MRFISTRGETPPLSFREAVATGLAPDGGLFLPESLPQITAGELAVLRTLDYPDLCTAFLRRFATDIEEETLAEIVRRSYTRFDHPEIAPLVRLDEDLHVLELFHGPTLAFKDFALQLLGNLYEYQCRESGQGINVLGATSGDTGAAAIHGLLGKPGVNIFILYPDGRVSPLQERQMTCTGADNVRAMAIEGSFDDAQAALKAIFADQDFRTSHHLSAVNSINLARVLAQCVYYLWAWLRLPEEQAQQVEFVVPTGNFGNVLAGWMLSRMGVPVGGFTVATNQNDILHRLFSTGEYRVDTVAPSLAPSMDIQVASNFERFLYYQLGEDPARVRAVMADIATTGRCDLGDFDRAGFSSSRCDDAAIPEVIRAVYEKYGYTVDPHTACALAVPAGERPRVVLATAHPAKFPETITDATGLEPTHATLETLKSRRIVKHPVAATPAAIREFIVTRAG